MTDTGSLLPDDAANALLIGRLWDPELGGPRVIVAHGNAVYDLAGVVGTVSELLERPDHLEIVQRTTTGSPSWRTDEVCAMRCL